MPAIQRFVICGDDTLAYRLADELINRHKRAVTVIMPSRASTYGRRIAKLGGVRIIESERPDTDAFQSARLDEANALALVGRNDVANIEAALQAHGLNPGLRIVVRMFNTSLSEGIAQLPYCTVLSDGALAAPAFVAAAVGEVTPTEGLRGGALVVARRDDVPAREVLCGLAVSEGREQADVLRAEQDAADLVLASAVPRKPAALTPRRRLTQRHSVGAILGRVWRRLRFVLAGFVGLLVAGSAILALQRSDGSWREAIYAATLAAFGGADAELSASALEQVTLLGLTIVSIALIPLLTGAVVDAVVKARLEVLDGTLPKRIAEHVVVVGLGGVGSYVIEGLHALGVDVVAIDKSADARGVQVARGLGIPLIIGDASRRDTLLAASVPTSRALVVITSDDSVNLETALIGRSVHHDLRVVLRLFDGDFAEQVQRAFDLTISRSVSYLAVPFFAARLLGQHLEAIPIDRRVLLMADLVVAPNSVLEEQTVGDLRRPGEAWLLEVTNTLGARLPSSLPSGRRLRRGEKLLMVATRAGLARLMQETSAPPDTAPRRPIVPHDSPAYHRSAPHPRDENDSDG
ncbi:NAD-binding protein [Micromonospora tarensis]|uniref:NAD-binding protein n=1 Tax=Micromonospora tarensis TaxID=2806100 RepID=A0ABS1YCL1_9ACTN|nr:NAD-binding protein [Micromonospora tarensis]MBM0275150.1 NAD-binding protein [Micromonospora tarensis]